MTEATGTVSTNGRTELNAGLQSDRLIEVHTGARMAERKADGTWFNCVQASFRRFDAQTGRFQAFPME